MEDFPAGPTGLGPRRPAFGGDPRPKRGSRLRACLRGLRDSTRLDHELIVVDDGSTDDSSAVARSFGATVFRNETLLGPASARNKGAKAADSPSSFFSTPMSFFMPTPSKKQWSGSTPIPISRPFSAPTTINPIIPASSVDFAISYIIMFINKGFFFDEAARPVATFWTGCGAIRRDVFLELGGFDPERYHRPAIEDIELGYRLNRGLLPGPSRS